MYNYKWLNFIFIKFDGIKLLNDNSYVFFDEKRVIDKLLLDNNTTNLYRSTMFEKTKSIIKLKQITDNDNDEITKLKITLAEYEFSEAKKNLENYLEKVLYDTLKHIEYMYISTDDISKI